MGNALRIRRYRALVVDDDDFVRGFVRDVLEKRGFEVYVAPDGKSHHHGAVNRAPDETWKLHRYAVLTNE